MLTMKVNGPRYKWDSGVMIWTVDFFTPLCISKEHLLVHLHTYKYHTHIKHFASYLLLVSMHTVFLPSTSVRIKIINFTHTMP